MASVCDWCKKFESCPDGQFFKRAGAEMRECSELELDYDGQTERPLADKPAELAGVR